MKDTFYFQHDYNPTDDLKVGAMLTEFGAIGYGLFWRLVEILHSEESHKIPHKKYVFITLAKQMLTNVEQIETFVKQCIEVYELFEGDGQFFWSNRVLRNIGKRNEIKEKRANAGKISAEKRKQAIEATLEPTHVEHLPTHVEQNSTNANKGKEKKEKESKGKKNKEEKDISELTLPFDSLNFLNAWNEFLEYRKASNKKVSYYAGAKIFKDLAKEDENVAIAMLEKAIKNDWQGVFPLNEAEKKQIKKAVAGFGLQSNIFEGLRFFYKNVPSEIYLDRDKCIAIPDSVFGYNKRVISYPEYTKFRNFLTQNGIDLDNLPAITFEPELFTKKEPIEI